MSASWRLQAQRLQPPFRGARLHPDLGGYFRNGCGNTVLAFRAGAALYAADGEQPVERAGPRHRVELPTPNRAHVLARRCAIRRSLNARYGPAVRMLEEPMVIVLRPGGGAGRGAAR